MCVCVCVVVFKYVSSNIIYIFSYIDEKERKRQKRNSCYDMRNLDLSYNASCWFSNLTQHFVYLGLNNYLALSPGQLSTSQSLIFF